MPLQVDNAVRFARAVNLSPTVWTAGALMLGRHQLELFFELRIAHDPVAQGAASGGDDLNHCLHSLGENRPRSTLSQLMMHAFEAGAHIVSAPRVAQRRGYRRRNIT